MQNPCVVTTQLTKGESIDERGFHRSLQFTTFEEADRLCKNIPHNGVKVAPLGGRSCPNQRL